MEQEDPEQGEELLLGDAVFSSPIRDIEAVDAETTVDTEDTTKATPIILEVNSPWNLSRHLNSCIQMNPSYTPLRKVSLTTNRATNLPTMRETSKEEGT